MAPTVVLFLGITLSLTYIVNAMEYRWAGDSNVDPPSPQSKQSLRDIAANPRYRPSSQTQNLRLPEISTLHSELQFNEDEYYDVDIGDRRTRIDLPWGPWSDWSLCSRSCGGGVAKRHRRCNRSNPTACVGHPVNVILCNTMECPPGRPTFREEQCIQHSRRIMTGKLAKYSWYPYLSDGIHSCHIYCTAKQVRFIQPFGIAIDGTRCGEGGKDTCIDGECVEVGCDMVVGSKTSIDACGVCGGNNSTCYHFSGSYYYTPEVTEFLNYNEIAKIPAGSSHIFVKDYSTNYLALMEADDHFEQYIVNGNRLLSWPGRYETAGTAVQYQRINDTETFEIKGPTTKDIYIMILFMESEPLIEYDYWIPQSLRPRELIEAPVWHDYGDDYYEPPNIAPSLIKDYYNGGHDPTLLTSAQVDSATTTTTTTAATTTENNNLTSVASTIIETTAATVRTFPNSSTTATSTVTETVSNKTRSKPCKGSSRRCQKCKKTRNRKLSYCKGDFAIHAKVLSKRRYHHGSDIRYDIEVKTTYKSNFRLIPREYIWVSSSNCPKLRPLREYLLIGRKVQVDVSDRYGEGEKDTKHKRYETRLVVEKTDYWASWRKSFERRMEKLSNKLECDSYLRRIFSRQQRKARAKKSKNRHPN